jgi:hypothetical protein
MAVGISIMMLKREERNEINVMRVKGMGVGLLLIKKRIMQKINVSCN